MVRRRIAKEPISQLASWARRCALFSLAATVIVIVIVRAEWIEANPSMAAVAGALSIAGLSILLALAALIVIWRDGIDGLGRAVVAMFIGGLLLAYPAYLGYRYIRTPAIADVTTDFTDPPKFDQVARLPGGAPNYPGATIAARQRSAYPDIETLQMSTSAQMAFEAASAVITKRKWNVILNRSPQPGRRDGQIEAVARSPVLGFREYVVVRVRGSADGARIDVRSASRYGQHDLGSNATRVRSLLEDIDDTATALAEDRNKKAAAKPPPPVKTPPQPAKR